MRRLVVLGMLLVAGCSAPAPPEDAPAAGASEVTLWLTTSGFTGDAPTGAEAERVPSGNFFRAWAAGEGLPTWRGAPPARDLLVRNATVVVWAEAPRGSAQAGSFPAHIAYFGAAPFLMAQASLAPPGVVPPGDVRELVFDLGMPRGGLVLPAGEGLELLVTPVQTQDDAADAIHYLVNATDRPSRVVLQVEPVVLAAEGSVESDTSNGRVAGSAYVLGAREGATAALFDVPVPADATRVEVVMEVGQKAGIPDVDVTLLDEDGEEVASSVTPYGREAVRLLAPNLDGLHGTTLTARVVNYGSAYAEFRLTTTTAGAAGD
ncbi:MAG TPA: hypothetical protein VI997_05510 [Candidatus Thermoplasmatota archaeon]|nr:hypothetical protein [Candidatus Thermoplasmatota archaeon]